MAEQLEQRAISEPLSDQSVDDEELISSAQAVIANIASEKESVVEIHIPDVMSASEASDDESSNNASSDSSDNDMDSAPKKKRKKRMHIDFGDKRSKVHTHFEKVPSQGPNAKRCLLCNFVYQSSGTSNMWDHLRRQHHAVFMSLKKKQSDHSKTAEKEKVPVTEQGSQSLTQATLENFCFTSKGQKKKKQPENSGQHLQVAPTQRSAQLDLHFYDLLISLEGGCTSLTSNQAFLKILKMASFHYKCPSDITELENAIKHRADSKRDLLWTNLSKIQHYTITISFSTLDGSEFEETRFLTIGIIYYDENIHKTCNAVLSVTELSMNADPCDVTQVVETSISEWGVHNPSALIIGIDRLLVRAFASWRDKKIPTFVCFKQTMCLAEANIVSYIKNKTWVANALEVVQYFSNSNKRNLLQNPDTMNGVEKLDFVETLEFAVTMADELQFGLWKAKDPTAPLPIEDFEVADLKLVCEFLKKLSAALLELNDIEPIIVSEVLNYRASFLAEFEEMNGTSFGRQLCDEAKRIVLDSTRSDFHDFMCFATMHDPRTRGISCLEPLDRQMAIQRMNRYFRQPLEESSTPSTERVEDMSSNIRHRNAERLRSKRTEPINVGYGMSTQLKGYLEEKDGNIEDAYGDFWKERKSFPLYKNAIKFQSTFVSMINPKKINVCKGLESVRKQIIFLRHFPEYLLEN